MRIILATALQLPKIVKSWIAPNLKMFAAARLPVVWALSLVIGLLVAVAAVAFRTAIGLVQLPWLGTMSEQVASAAGAIPWWVILLAPATGGLIVGLMLEKLQAKQRVGGVADVIEARAQGGRGLPFWPGMSSAAITVLSLGSGASAGREGPMVHLGATIGAALCQTFRLPDSARRTLLACGVASAVSASFNAPIAGALFAHEVVLGHYALSAFVPIVIASAAGTLLSRLWFGDTAAFIIPDYQITSYWEFPAFALLGITCAAVAILFQFALIGSDWIARNISMPLWFRPVLGGLAVGAIGIAFPEVLGVGYEATDAALKQQLSISIMLALLVAKTLATAITLASRFGGGIFSPSVYLGAMTGGAFGLIAASAFPDMASSHGLYAILGMGAVTAAVIGAPISTTMIVFELTGGYALSIALLLCVSIATGITQAIHGRSFFHWQLEMRGVVLQDGAHRYLIRTVHVEDFMQRLDMPEALEVPEPGHKPVVLYTTDTLETALRTFDESGATRLPVVLRADPARVVGHAHHVRALSYFNSALIKAAEEEHR
ncbi:chloride channel protein [Polymorphum gilvum]|uniref:Putative chloride transporter, ClC family n=1 Tax=Polymorphum gilvum (strain LMG 25793 / CGMCC 1.9160 / SL003B-26A1) TaxID=991905 RepID=F2J296_POLGS|nr:chloride channel protein [Polymorphum gilvum]ADZ69792.1 Putative chloride transporter, ClC family [Polymorphum gilvum SL003B-26A1]